MNRLFTYRVLGSLHLTLICLLIAVMVSTTLAPLLLTEVECEVVEWSEKGEGEKEEKKEQEEQLDDFLHFGEDLADIYHLHWDHEAMQHIFWQNHHGDIMTPPPKPSLV